MASNTYTSVDAYNSSDAAAIIDTVTALGEADLVNLVPETAVVVPKGKQLLSIKHLLDEQRAVPERICGTAELATLESFVEHVKAFARAETAIFANEHRLLAVYDYHGVGKDAEQQQVRPGWCAHRAEYRFPLSREWLAWMGTRDAPMSQSAFAEFLEDHVQDVVAPKDDDAKHFAELSFTLATPAQLMLLSRNLKVRVESEAVNSPNLSSGEVEIAYKEKHSDSTGAPLKIPGGFMLQIPVFVDGVAYRIPVRLRYRISGGKVAWQFVMHRWEVALKDAAQEAANSVKNDTGLPVYYGSPESE